MEENRLALIGIIVEDLTKTMIFSMNTEVMLWVEWGFLTKPEEFP